MITVKKLKIAIFLTLIITSLSNVILSNAISFEGKIHKNVYIEEIDLSNLTKKEATNKINSIIANNNSFTLYMNDKNYTFDKDYIDTVYKVEEAVKEAYSIGRSKGIINNFKIKADLDLGEEINIDLKYVYNENKLEDYLNCLNKEIYTEPVNSMIRINNENIVVTKEKYGYELDKNKMKFIINTKLKKLNSNKEVIPIIELKPQDLYKDLKKINTVLGRFETRFNPRNENRANNIRIAARATNNILLKKGDVFSFNSSIQNAHIDEYFKEAPIIMNGKQDKGKGGGICQVSSTIYNAALYSGLKIINITNHSIPSPYIEKGRDATVSEGYIDLKFSNNYDTPVFIYNQVFGNRIVATIYGNENDKKNIEIYTETIDIIPIKTIRKGSEKINLGEKEIEQEGRKGYKVRTYRIYKNNDGNKSEYISESYYPPQNKIIMYGTKEVNK